MDKKTLKILSGISLFLILVVICVSLFPIIKISVQTRSSTSEQNILFWDFATGDNGTEKVVGYLFFIAVIVNIIDNIIVLSEIGFEKKSYFKLSIILKFITLIISFAVMIKFCFEIGDVVGLLKEESSSHNLTSITYNAIVYIIGMLIPLFGSCVINIVVGFGCLNYNESTFIWLDKNGLQDDKIDSRKWLTKKFKNI